jgi:hypothetical protein
MLLALKGLEVARGDVYDAAVQRAVLCEQVHFPPWQDGVRHESHLLEAHGAARFHPTHHEAHLIHVALDEKMRGALGPPPLGDEVSDSVLPQDSRRRTEHLRQGQTHRRFPARWTGKRGQRMYAFYEG